MVDDVHGCTSAHAAPPPAPPLQPPSRPPAGALNDFSKKHVVATNKNSNGTATAEKSRWEPAEAELDELREFLAARPADSLPLETLRSDDPELGSKAKALMSRDGFVRLLQFPPLLPAPCLGLLP